MRELNNTFRFLLACVVIFASGYLSAKPRNDADNLFAPLLCALAVYLVAWTLCATLSLPPSNSQ